MSNPYAKTYTTSPDDRAARAARKTELEQKQVNNTITKDETDELANLMGQMNMNRGGRRRRRTFRRRTNKKRSTKRRRR
jgi:hypothetical protein